MRLFITTRLLSGAFFGWTMREAKPRPYRIVFCRSLLSMKYSLALIAEADKGDPKNLRARIRAMLSRVFSTLIVISELRGHCVAPLFMKAFLGLTSYRAV
jgi:hypothetical protein